MNSKKPTRKEILASCDEVGPEDGLDPRRFLRKTTGKVVNRKALQLCSQVARTLRCVLAGECADELLRDLMVESVVPAPNSSRLLVTVSLNDPTGAVSPDLVLKHLALAQGRLRAEVAAVIHRKKVPELTFRLAGREEPGSSECR
jgi:ribosome-binding factor A